MGRFCAGLLIAMGCHILLLAMPVYRSSLEPSPLPTAKAITVRFNAMKPSQSPKNEIPAIPPKPVIAPKQTVETVPQPKPESKTSNPKPKVRKIVKKKKLALKPPQPSPPAKPRRVLDKAAPNDPRPKPVTESMPTIQSLKPKTLPTEDKKGFRSAVVSPTPPPIRKAYPKIGGNPPPKYPTLARRRGWEGTVQLSVLVLENGKVGEISVAKSSGYPPLDDAALKAVGQYRFIPGEKGDQKIAMRVTVPVHFRLQSAD